MTKQITHRKETPVKKRDSDCYQKKVRRITAWYNRLVELRKKPVKENEDKEHTDKTLRKRKQLQNLEYYIDKIKKASN